MRINNHTVSQEDIKNIKSIKDPNALKLAREAKPGVNPFYYTIGTMGGISVRDKYASVEAMETLERETDINPSNTPNAFEDNQQYPGQQLH